MTVIHASYEIGVIAARLSTHSPCAIATFHEADESIATLISSLGGLFNEDSFIDGFTNETHEELGENGTTEAKNVLAALQNDA